MSMPDDPPTTVPYEQFAPHYDAWQESFGAPYHALVAPRVLDTLDRHAPFGRRIADIGCGTGGLTCTLVRRGYFVVALDSSPAMLAIARERVRAAALDHPPTLGTTDIRQLHVIPPLDAAVCMYTVINHLTGPGDLDAAFAAVSRSLVPQGLFVFDLNLPACYDRYWSGPETVDLGDAIVHREHVRHPASPLIRADLTIERRHGDRSEVVRDRLEQRVYEDTEIEGVLKKTGFSLLERTTFNPFDAEADAVKALWSVRRA
jgi:SAM-dependent methyltransferase